MLACSNLYGARAAGRSVGNGTVLAGNTDGQGFTNLYSFTGGSDGSAPYAGLILSSNTLYGTAAYGGSSGNGTVFKVNTDGAGFTNLHSFTGGSGYPSYTNSAGTYPDASLILSSHILYGTAASAGGSRGRTLFN